MALLQLLYFCTAHYSKIICVQHNPGSSNKIANAISHFQDACFKKLALEAKVTPDNIPAWPTQAFTFASCSSTIMV